MLLESVSYDELQKIITQLNQTIYDHQQWHNHLMRVLICEQDNDKNDSVTVDQCSFDQWYAQVPNKLQEHSGFVAIGTAHQHLHKSAKNLLAKTKGNNKISTNEYDDFVKTLERLRLEIFSLKNELETLLYSRDPLTMAISRVNMLPMLREQQALVVRHNQPCCIAMMDLDSFKKINDQHGHPAGDKILSSLVRYIIKCLRPYDKIFRYGGEKFLLCIPHAGLKQGYEVLDRLRKEISETPIGVEEVGSIHITVSMGLGLLDSNDPVEQSIDRIDKAINMAKSSGRNCIRVWDPNTQNISESM